ncbi:MAG: PTS sugar transporter subunit IIC [Eubacterium sp.]
MSEFLNDKVMPKIMAFINTKAMRALKEGVMYSMPMIMIGALFMLLANFPVSAVTDALASAGLTPVFNQISNSSFGIIALIAAVGIAYTYVKNEGISGLPAGIISLVSFLILMPSSVNGADGSSIGAILKDWTGGKGMIGAIICGLLTGWIYTIFISHHIGIKMPDSVPEGVSNAFTALVPGTVILTAAGVIYAITEGAAGITPIEAIYQGLQAPLQGMTDSLGGAVLMGFLIPFLWFFGVHGSTIVGDGTMGPLLLANSADNQAILDAGKALTIANGGHIVTKQFLDQILVVTGSGITIGLVLFMVLWAKSKQMKELGRLSIIPSLFNVNEPLLFGTPIVLNPILAVPFFLTPMIASIVEYFAIYTGLCPLYSGVVVPWTTPVIISGFLVGGWRTALLQAVVILISVAMYYPFARVLDRTYLAQETEQKD